MASNYWIKLYHEVLNDPKMGTMPDRLWRRCIEFFLMAGEYNQQGALPDVNEIAWTLRCDPDELESELRELAKKGIVEEMETGWLVVNFAKRQAAASSTERSRQQRQREVPGDKPIKTKEETWAQSIYKTLPELPGIYLMRCAGSERYYVGGSVNIQKRIRTHLTEIKSIKQHPMHSDFITHGAASFTVEVLELVDDSSQLAEKEIEWMSKYPKDSLYNTDPGKRHHSWDKTNNDNLDDIDETNRPDDETNRPTDTDTDTDKESTPNGVAVKPQPTRSKPEPIPAVKVHVEVTGKYLLNKAQIKEIAEVVGDTPMALEKWRSVVKAWLMRDYKPTRIDGMLEWFRDGIPVYQNGASNGTHKNQESGRTPAGRASPGHRTDAGQQSDDSGGIPAQVAAAFKRLSRASSGGT